MLCKCNFLIIFSIFLLFYSCENSGSVKTQVVKSICGNSFNPEYLNEFPSPQKIDGIGTCQLKITTKSEIAQSWFNQGLNLLHDFWHIEAYRAFKEVIKADTTCAMGYWGLAMCQPAFASDQYKEWYNAIKQAKALQTNCTPIEIGLIDAMEVVSQSGLDGALPMFRELCHRFPDEPEVIAFSTIMMRQTNNDMNGSIGKEILDMLNKALVKFPNHVGLLHYYVHMYELRPDFENALSTAIRLTEIAPNSPHLQHMPGHLYFLKGEYKKAIEVFSKARKVAVDFHTKNKIPFEINQDYLHNLHFLALSESELNHYEKAIEAATTYANTTIGRDETDINSLVLLYNGRILPALVNIRFSEWEKAADNINFWLTTPAIPLNNTLVKYYLQAMYKYCKGMEAVQNGNFDDAQNFGQELTVLMKNFEREATQKSQSIELKLIKKAYDVMSMSRYELAGWIDNADSKIPFSNIAFNEAITLQNSMRYEEPPRLMYPIEESIAKLHIQRGETKLAKISIEKALEKRPKSQIIQNIKIN